MKQYFLLLAVLPLLWGCGLMDGNGDSEGCAQRWGEAYFSCDFQKAQEYTTAEGHKWLQFAASNMTEEDLALINGREDAVEVSVTDLYVGNDTMATAMLQVSYWLSFDAIGHSSIKENGVFSVDLVKRDGKWQVRMAGLPQSEKQSRD